MSERRFQIGDWVRCLDDSDGAHFLRRGGCYLVEHVQVDDAGTSRVSLLGMARAWEEERFEGAAPAPGPWTVETATPWPCHSICGADGSIVASTFAGLPTATLLASAPRLLELLGQLAEESLAEAGPRDVTVREALRLVSALGG